MATKRGEKPKAKGKGVGKIKFNCRFCGQSNPLEEMTMVAGYFPQLLACRDCAKKM